mmetsp:Transcript_27413/g.64764  ORF Transcript_27413/g.64764 Transcript_27413/m.64764 type:complete len:225 (-) Transcript_27413:832-1506(-)
MAQLQGAGSRHGLVLVLVLALVLGALGAGVEAAVDLVRVLAAPGRVCILTAAVVVPHPARAVLRRVRQLVVHQPPQVLAAPRLLEEVDRDCVVTRPLVHALGRDACHVDRTVVGAHPSDVKEPLALCARDPEAERHVLVLPPHARPALALLEAHPPALTQPRLDPSLGTRHEGGHLGRGAHVADERRREQFEGTVHKGEGRVGTLVRAPFLAVVCTAGLPRPAA